MFFPKTFGYGSSFPHPCKEGRVHAGNYLPPWRINIITIIIITVETVSQVMAVSDQGTLINCLSDFNKFFHTIRYTICV